MSKDTGTFLQFHNRKQYLLKAFIFLPFLIPSYPLMINTQCYELFVSLCDGLAFEKDDDYLGACFPQNECCILEATKLQWGEGAALPFSRTGRRKELKPLCREPADQKFSEVCLGRWLRNGLISFRNLPGWEMWS